MATPKNRPGYPGYRIQKFPDRQDLAFIVLNGKKESLGPYRAPSSYDEYDEIMAQYKAGTYQSPSDTPGGITIVELLAAYVEHLKTLHAALNPEPDIGKQVEAITAAHRQAMKPLREFYGDLEVINFGPKKLKQVRDIWIERSLGLPENYVPASMRVGVVMTDSTAGRDGVQVLGFVSKSSNPGLHYVQTRRC